MDSSQYSIPAMQLEARFGDLQRLALEQHVGPGVLDALLESAQLHIVGGHVTQQGDEHVVVVLD